jgi:hypothetical protein
VRPFDLHIRRLQLVFEYCNALVSINRGHGNNPC